MRFEIEKIIGEDFLSSHPTGSNYICDPPVNNTDIDYAVLIAPGKLDDIRNQLPMEKWILGGSPAAGGSNPSNWASFKKDNINLIITDDAQHYKCMLVATKLAKNRNLLLKQDRINLFQEVFKNLSKYDNE